MELVEERQRESLCAGAGAGAGERRGRSCQDDLVAVVGGYFDDHECAGYSQRGSVSGSQWLGFWGDGKWTSDDHQGPNCWSAACGTVLASAACGSQFHRHRHESYLWLRLLFDSEL